MSSDAPLVFVYGTLRSDGEMHHLLGDVRCGPATATGCLWRMPAGYPAMSLEGHGTVHGEWAGPVDPTRLSLIDVYEGVGEGLYQRTTVTLTTPSGAHLDAVAWVMRNPDLRGGRPIPSGRWVAPPRHRRGPDPQTLD